MSTPEDNINNTIINHVNDNELGHNFENITIRPVKSYSSNIFNYFDVSDISFSCSEDEEADEDRDEADEDELNHQSQREEIVRKQRENIKSMIIILTEWLAKDKRDPYYLGDFSSFCSEIASSVEKR